MARQLRKKSNNGLYHVMLRGNERKNIFFCDDDKHVFIETIYRMKQKQRFNLHAYCLMDNHVHFMISEDTEDISKVIKRIAISYAYYVNKKYNRVGHLFQDRFKSEVVSDNAYIVALARYIHNNPRKAGMITELKNYKWSSYNGYFSEQNHAPDLLDMGLVLGMFSTDENIARQLFFEYMNEDNDDCFLELDETQEIMDDYKALQLYRKMLQERGMTEDNGKTQIPVELFIAFKEASNLSIRRIAKIAGMKKDKLHLILKQSKQ